MAWNHAKREKNDFSNLKILVTNIKIACCPYSFECRVSFDHRTALSLGHFIAIFSNILDMRPAGFALKGLSKNQVDLYNQLPMNNHMLYFNS